MGLEQILLRILARQRGISTLTYAEYASSEIRAVESADRSTVLHYSARFSTLQGLLQSLHVQCCASMERVSKMSRHCTPRALSARKTTVFDIARPAGVSTLFIIHLGRNCLSTQCYDHLVEYDMLEDPPEIPTNLELTHLSTRTSTATIILFG